MSSSADARGPSYSSLKLAESSAEVETIFGEGAPATRIVCGVFFFADEDHPAVVGFPSCIHVPADARQAPWLAGLTQTVVAEAMERGPGSDVVMARLSDALVTRALRYHLETNKEPGWLHGLRDPAISRAPSALHSDLRYPWTVAGLARTAGASGLRRSVQRVGRSEPDGVCPRLPNASRRDIAPDGPSHRGGNRFAGRLQLRISAIGGVPALLRYDAGGVPQAVVGRIMRNHSQTHCQSKRRASCTRVGLTPYRSNLLSGVR
jgi:hypothetical protein